MKTMQKGFTLIELMIVVAIIAILAAIAIPAYQNYVIRAQVTEGMSLADGAKTGMSEFYASTGRWPSTNTSAGIANAASITGNYVSSANVGTTAGMITVIYDNKANTAISGDILALSATPNGGSISWTCKPTGTYTTVSAVYLPASCRS